MVSYGGLWGILSGLTKSTDRPSRTCGPTSMLGTTYLRPVRETINRAIGPVRSTYYPGHPLPERPHVPGLLLWNPRTSFWRYLGC